MKRLLAAVSLAVALSSFAQTPAPAISPAKQAKVEKLFDAMHVERSTEQMMDYLHRVIVQATESSPGLASATPAQKQMVVDYQEKAMKLASDTVGWKAMKAEYVRLYATDFTDDELDGMIAFYNSPAGKAMLDKTPQITQQTMGIVQQKMVTLQPQIKQLMEELAMKMKSSAPASATPKAAPGAGK